MLTKYSEKELCEFTGAVPALPLDVRQLDLEGRISSDSPVLGREFAHPLVAISSPENVRRRTMTISGVAVEHVQCIGQNKIEIYFRAPVHLLIAYEKGERREGETLLEGLPKSNLRNFSRKLTFVPAGRAFHETLEPRAPARLLYFYFDPSKLDLCSDMNGMDASFSPRLFFEDAAMWHTIYKVLHLFESPVLVHPRYFEALGVVLMHEIVRLDRGLSIAQPPRRGGLAAWQQRIVIGHIEKHLTERIPLTTLAQLVNLSPHHFCRAFKESFGVPPHRYQTNRRMEEAKRLLASPKASVTEIGLALGFSDASSFATAFRKTTGFTPTSYQRKIG